MRPRREERPGRVSRVPVPRRPAGGPGRPSPLLRAVERNAANAGRRCDRPGGWGVPGHGHRRVLRRGRAFMPEGASCLGLPRPSTSSRCATASPHWPGLHRGQLTAGTAAARPGDRPRRASVDCHHPEWACPARPSRPPSPALWSPVAAVGDPCRPAADPARATSTRAVPVRAAGLARHSCRQPDGRSRCRPDPA
jgi:hypothetical protein